MRGKTLKTSLSLKMTVILAFFSFSAILIAGYSVLSARFFSMGVAHVIVDNMVITVDNYHRSVAGDSRKDVDYWGTYRITRDWRNMPAGVRRAFPEALPPSGQLRVAKQADPVKRSAASYYVLAVEKDDTVYYVSQWTGFSTPLGIFGWNSNKNIRFLVILSCSIGAAIAVILWFVIRAVSQPITGLNDWAQHLDRYTVKEKIPDFSFVELNELATLLHGKIAAEHEQLERGLQFVHHASHELRTPVTAISQNVEVLNRVLPLDTTRSKAMAQRALMRLGRATENIGSLIETLLWVGRDSSNPPQSSEIRIDRLVRQIVRNLAFLLKGKGIKVKLETCPGVVFAPEAPLRIVLTNLIRNAFQHTSEGTVLIRLEKGGVSISNSETACANALGFGFGLDLTRRLVGRMNWSYNCISAGGRRIVSIEI